jgi:hypothetical protein
MPSFSRREARAHGARVRRGRARHVDLRVAEADERRGGAGVGERERRGRNGFEVEGAVGVRRVARDADVIRVAGDERVARERAEARVRALVVVARERNRRVRDVVDVEDRVAERARDAARRDARREAVLAADGRVVDEEDVRVGSGAARGRVADRVGRAGVAEHPRIAVADEDGAGRFVVDGGLRDGDACGQNESRGARDGTRHICLHSS